MASLKKNIKLIAPLAISLTVNGIIGVAILRAGGFVPNHPLIMGPVAFLVVSAFINGALWGVCYSKERELSREEK